MTTMTRLPVIGALLLLCLPLAAQEGNVVVKLTVKRDGHEQPPPGHVVIIIDKQSVQVPVRRGTFEVPADLVAAPEITFTTNVGEDAVRIPKLPGKALMRESWTLLLAGRRYDNDYQWVVPKGATVGQSCILAFDTAQGEPGTAVFVPNCRSKRD
jgi:hypothetical protein